MATVTKSIGTAGRDYSTIQAWQDDLDNGAEYNAADDAVGEMYADSDFGGYVNLNGGSTLGLNSVRLTVASGQEHDGTANTGARLLLSGTGGDCLGQNWNYTSTIELLELDMNGQNSSNAIRTGTTGSPTISRVIIHNFLSNKTSGSDRIAITLRATAGSTSTVQNSILYDIAGLNARTANGIDFDHGTAGNAVCQAFNCTVYNCESSNVKYDDLAANENVQNIISCVSGGMCFNPGTNNNANLTNLASSDATAIGPGAIDNVVTADQFVSIVGGSEDLHLKAGSDCIGAGIDLGTTPPGVNIDIDGRDRDAEGDIWDIGAHQFVSGVQPPTGTKSLTASKLLNSPLINSPLTS